MLLVFFCFFTFKFSVLSTQGVWNSTLVLALVVNVDDSQFVRFIGLIGGSLNREHPAWKQCCLKTQLELQENGRLIFPECHRRCGKDGGEPAPFTYWEDHPEMRSPHVPVTDKAGGSKASRGLCCGVWISHLLQRLFRSHPDPETSRCEMKALECFRAVVLNLWTVTPSTGVT